MKNILAIAVATALIAPAAAMADTTLYGKVHVSAGSVDKGGAGSETVLESHGSRLGVKGSTELDNGLSATYGLEYGLDVDGDNGKQLNARNTFVGLKGGFGEVRVGRHDTPAKLATVGLDVFGDTYGMMDNIIVNDNHRVDNAVAYINKFGPVGFAYAHSTSISGNDATNGGANAADSVMANYSNGPIYAGLGYTAVDSVGKATNLGVSYKTEAGHFANVVFEKAQGDAASTPALSAATAMPPAGAKDTNVYAGGGIKSGAMTFKAAYGESKRDGAGKEKQTTVGVDYGLGKKTNAYLMWTEDQNAAHAIGGSVKDKATVVGLTTDF